MSRFEALLCSPCDQVSPSPTSAGAVDEGIEESSTMGRRLPKEAEEAWRSEAVELAAAAQVAERAVGVEEVRRCVFCQEELVGRGVLFTHLWEVHIKPPNPRKSNTVCVYASSSKHDLLSLHNRYMVLMLEIQITSWVRGIFSRKLKIRFLGFLFSCLFETAATF